MIVGNTPFLFILSITGSLLIINQVFGDIIWQIVTAT
jgi:hypothetical protein